MLRPLTFAETELVMLPLGVNEQTLELAPLKPLLWKPASVTYSKWQLETLPPFGFTVPPRVALVLVSADAAPVVVSGGSGGRVWNDWLPLSADPPKLAILIR